ncbi:Crp/Fnr family transcriptional regulator [Streptomyces sp. NPDC056909]|uniref:Crp/Fnr family transcriptional regulator n=1 Tax=unclassified Streptomyces TaxID=2593676 RepID=UPI00368F1663
MTRSTLLADLSSEGMAELGRSGTLVVYPAGRTLMREGDEDRHVLILLDGCAKVVGVSPGGRESLLAIRVAGDLVGELAALDGKPRSATVTAVLATTARRLSGDEFLALLGRHPGDWLTVSRYVTAKLRDANRSRVHSGSPVVARTARVLIELAEKFGRPVPGGVLVDMPLPQSALAGLVGASEPALHRALTGLRRGGAVDTGYRRIMIVNSTELERAMRD